MNFCNYINEYNIYVIDYSGHIDMKEGVERIDKLKKFFTDHIKEEDILKILLNAKGYIKDNPETHDALAKLARTKFTEGMNSINIFMAVLNDNYTCYVSEKEHWFISREDAINWLVEQ